MPRACLALDEVPSDPQIRNLLDPVPPEQLAAPFWRVFEHLRAGDYRVISATGAREQLCALDGTQYFGSEKIHCAECSTRVVNGRSHHSHSLVAPLLVAPGENRVIAVWNRSSSARRMAAKSKIVNCVPPHVGLSATPGALRRVR